MQDSGSYNEWDVLRQVAEGDEQAFGILFTAWSSRLYQFTFQLTRSRETAEDIVQDSFLKIWLRRDRLAAIDNFSAYLFRMARNAVADGVRRKGLELAMPDRIGGGNKINDDPETGLHIKLVKRVLEQAIRNLPEQQHKIWRLNKEHGKRAKEIADELGISESTVKQHLHRATTSLRAELLREFPLEGGILLVILGITG